MTVPWGHSIGKNMAAGSIVCGIELAENRETNASQHLLFACKAISYQKSSRQNCNDFMPYGRVMLLLCNLEDLGILHPTTCR